MGETGKAVGKGGGVGKARRGERKHGKRPTRRGVEIPWSLEFEKFLDSLFHPILSGRIWYIINCFACRIEKWGRDLRGQNPPDEGDKDSQQEYFHRYP